MATNNSKVTIIQIILNDIRNSRCQEFIHPFNHGGTSWKLTLSYESSNFGQSSNSISNICSFLTLKTSGASKDSVVSTNEIDNAKIEILNNSEIPIFSFIGKCPLNWIRVCNLTCLYENHKDSVPDGKCKAILTIGPLNLLTPASKDVAPNVPRDKSPMESLKSMLDEGILTDMVIKTSTKTFPCHKVVLASSSEVFKAMFETEMIERTDNEVKLEGVFEAATIQDLLHYLYTKQTPPNINNTCSTLFVAADYFQLPVLKAVCEEKLCTMVIVENAADILQLAEKYSADALKKTAVNFIVSHYKDVMNTPGWKEIPDDMTRYLLSTFLVTVAEKMKI